MITKLKYLSGVLATLALLLTLQTEVRAETVYLALPHPIKEGGLEQHVDALNNAKFGDKVVITTDSGGGSVLEMHRLVVALKTSNAESHCVVNNFAASAAAIITVACDSYSMDAHARLLFHMPSRYYSIAGVDLFSDCITVDDLCPDYAKKANMFANYMQALGVRRMMTEQQWDLMIHGTDIILTPMEIEQNLRKNR